MKLSIWLWKIFVPNGHNLWLVDIFSYDKLFGKIFQNEILKWRSKSISIMFCNSSWYTWWTKVKGRPKKQTHLVGSVPIYMQLYLKSRAKRPKRDWLTILLPIYRLKECPLAYVLAQSSGVTHKFNFKREFKTQSRFKALILIANATVCRH